MTLKTNLISDQLGPGSTTVALPSGPSREGSEKFATGDEWRNECREMKEERNLKRNVAKEEIMIGTWNVRLLRQCGENESFGARNGSNELECTWNFRDEMEGNW